MDPKTGIHWFRHDLRLDDNHALSNCHDEVERFIPIFIFDDETAGTDICGFIRFRHLLQSLEDLKTQFKEANIDFMCFHGKPHDVIEKLIKEWNVKMVTFSTDSESRMVKRDSLVHDVCEKNDVQVLEFVSHTLYDPKELFAMNGNTPATTLDEFRKFCDTIGEPEKPLPKPDFKNSNLCKTGDLYVEQLHKIPTLEELKIRPECPEQMVCLFPGGETVAQKLFARRLELEQQAFENDWVNPNLTKPILFSEEISLSPYLRMGSLSVRRFYWDLHKIFHKYYKGNKTFSDAAEQLFWREFFYQQSHKNDYYFQIEKNPMTFKIPWEWNKVLFEKWEKGQTGYPWIDACMRQLRQEGWIHHICRNSVAIFLTRGDMFQPWMEGLKTFLKYLIDADRSICAGNWNYISSGDPEALVDPANNFCPIKNGKKIDPEGIYVRKYVPELKNFNNEFLLEPWKASLDQQEEADCIIGKDYPEPMLDHDEAFGDNINKLNQFFNTINNCFVNNNATENYKTFTYHDFLAAEFDDF